MANTTAPPVLPTDAKRIALMLAARGVEDADERVLAGLLDFAYRYTSDILEDAQAYADHANRPGRVETADVEMAVQARSGWEYTEAAPKDYLLPIARELNKIPLPTLNAAYAHIALPPAHLMLGQPNFRIVPRFPAPESLGLFKVGDAAEDEEGSEDEDFEDDDDSGSERSEGGDAGKAAGEEDGDHAMDTDPTTPPPPPPQSGTTETEHADATDGINGINGTKRRLEEDDDYDAD